MYDNSIIIVGNGEGILRKKNGYKIDMFDKVVRLGRYVTGGFEEYAGSKTDIISTIYWKLDKERLKQHKVILNVPLNYQHNFIESEDYISKEFPEYRENIIYLNKFEDAENIKQMYLEVMPTFKGIDNVNFSLGFKTFYFIRKLFPNRKIYVTGFDFFKTGWYWDPTHNRNDSNMHPYLYERLWYMKMKVKGVINEL